MNPTVELVPLSGAAGLEGNAFLLMVDDFQLLLDCGSGSARNSSSWLRRLKTAPDLVWLSHMHGDHIGALPQLLERFPHARCATSTQSHQLAPFAFAHCGMNPRRAEALASKLQPIEPLTHVAIHQLNPQSSVQGLQVTAYPAGHLLGAAGLMIEVERRGRTPFRMFYTGDFCCHDQVLVNGALFPRLDEGTGVDVLISETVLANDKAADTVEYCDELARFIADFTQTSTPRLVAAAALGEACEIAAACLISSIDVVVHEYMRPAFQAYSSMATDKVCWKSLRFLDTAGCKHVLESGELVIAPGDQLQRGSVAGELAWELIARRDARIGLLNRVHKGTAAAKLLHSKREEMIMLHGARAKRYADVKHYTLVTHASRWQLLGTVRALNPEQVVLVHGTFGAMHALRRAIEKDGYQGTISIPKNGETLSLT